MRVRYLVFGTGSATGGIRSVVNQANALADRHDVEIVSVFKRRRPPFRLDPRVRRRTLMYRRRNPLKRLLLSLFERVPSRVVPEDENRFADFSLATDLVVRRYLKQVDADVVVATRPALNLMAARFGPRSITRIGEDHMNLRTYKPKLAGAIRRWYPELDAVTVLTTPDAAEYREALGAAARVEHLPNMVPVATRPPAPLDAKVIVAAGRLTRQKGFDLLIDAFTRVHETHPDWQLRIYGRGPLRGALSERIERHGLTGHVRLMGSTRRFEQALRAGSMFVLSSRYEGLPMTVLESMTQGVPVVAFDCHTGPADIITHGADGLLVPPGKPAELARAMCELIADPERRRSLGANAYASVARFTAPNVGRRWDGLFAELRPPAPTPGAAVNAAGLGYDET